MNNVLKIICGLLFCVFLGSCSSDLKEVQRFNVSEFFPSGEADSIDLKYTDQGVIKAILKGAKMKDYAFVKYPFTEFPEGLEVTLYDENGKRSFVIADFATTYKGTDLIDLRGNVEMRTEDGQRLETEQIYFDQKNQWFYTEKKFKFSNQDGSYTTGEGVDFNRDFTRINYQKVYSELNQK